MEQQPRELPAEYLEKIQLAVEGNPQIQRQLAENAQKLKATLDASYKRVSDRNDAEIKRFEKAVGRVPEFVGVITRI